MMKKTRAFGCELHENESLITTSFHMIPSTPVLRPTKYSFKHPCRENSAHKMFDVAFDLIKSMHRAQVVTSFSIWPATFILHRDRVVVAFGMALPTQECTKSA